ncbi:hypothetical protein D3C71_1114170 [compost metagenome]
MSTVSVAPAWVASISKNSTGVRPSRRTISSVRPSTFCDSTHAAALRTTVSSRPCSAQSGENMGDLAGMAM